MFLADYAPASRDDLFQIGLLVRRASTVGYIEFKY